MQRSEQLLTEPVELALTSMLHRNGTSDRRVLKRLTNSGTDLATTGGL